MRRLTVPAAAVPGGQGRPVTHRGSGDGRVMGIYVAYAPTSRGATFSARGAKCARATSWVATTRAAISSRREPALPDRRCRMLGLSDNDVLRRIRSHRLAGLLAAVSFFLAMVPLAAAQTPTGEAVMAWHVTIAPTWFDPSTAPAQITPFGMLHTLHDALVRPLPGQKMGSSLAESWTESPDGLTYEFKLRRGLKFHNGDPVTAEDVKFSFERYRGTGAKELQARAVRQAAGDEERARRHHARGDAQEGRSGHGLRPRRTRSGERPARPSPRAGGDATRLCLLDRVRGSVGPEIPVARQAPAAGSELRARSEGDQRRRVPGFC